MSVYGGTVAFTAPSMSEPRALLGGFPAVSPGLRKPSFAAQIGGARRTPFVRDGQWNRASHSPV